ncbi:MAG TPA: [protein-PII] uridylyltransferase [Myxococcaceae bacterium]
MSLVTTLDPRGLRPPIPPPQTHPEERERLPAFSRGGPEDRLERARAYRKATAAHVEALHRQYTSGLSICRLIAECLDRLVRGLFEELSAQMQPPPGLALAALGGYGRKETAPHSDVDLLLLRSPSVREEAVRPFAKAFNTLLWDSKLVVGWSVRTPSECARAAEDDHTVRTALLDCRYLAGDEKVYSQLADQVLRELLTHAADRFIADKSLELRERRLKYGDSIYLLEPNIKAGEGGLRDLEAALWIAQARYRTRGLRALLKEAVLPASEVNLLTSARDFLMRIRNHLHILRGRKEDRLTFDLQDAVATFLGYQPGPEGLPVEQFMRHYYLSAKAIRTAAGALIARCEEGMQRRPGAAAADKKVPPFKVFQGKLTLDGEASLLSREPHLSLRLFRVADELGVPLYSWARDQVLHALPALEAARDHPAVTQELKALLGRPGTRGALLFDLHDLGVLGAAVPEFGRVTALHQHQLYHVYTVDVHTLFAVRRLYALRAGDLQAEVPELSRLMQALADPLPLYLGMLLHDVGKGLGGRHSERGKEIASQVAARLQLTARQTEIVEHLVLHHLAMSETSQRRDLSDPDLIAQFAARCGDVEKLTCLYVLTYADMCSVSPTVWNEWRARLLEELFVKARAYLLGATAGPDASASKEAFAVRWRRALGPRKAEGLLQRLPERYFLSTPPARAVLHARLLDRATLATLAAAVRSSEAQGCIELTLAARDRPGLLALFAGVLSAHGLDILSAQIASTDDGLALDAFTVRAAHGGELERHRWRKARADLARVLEDRATVEEILRKHRGGALLQRALPPVRADVTLDNRASARFTVVDVLAQDRVGLLYAIARALHQLGVEIALAKVATEAHRAIDSFYVTASGQKVEEPAARARLLSAVREAVEALPA